MTGYPQDGQPEIPWSSDEETPWSWCVWDAFWAGIFLGFAVWAVLRLLGVL